MFGFSFKFFFPSNSYHKLEDQIVFQNNSGYDKYSKEKLKSSNRSCKRSSNKKRADNSDVITVDVKA